MDVDVERCVEGGERSELMSEPQEDEVDGICQSKTSGLFHNRPFLSGALPKEAALPLLNMI